MYYFINFSTPTETSTILKYYKRGIQLKKFQTQVSKLLNIEPRKIHINHFQKISQTEYEQWYKGYKPYYKHIDNHNYQVTKDVDDSMFVLLLLLGAFFGWALYSFLFPLL